ncbi:hypothetical protein SAMN04489867_0804 [Pedococcus dokdonensis]|uniref:Uncharacterized protein n=1 Tax=Pedococcus dokdonensis TaxID=443156 RepID=A0A1H0N2T5_9MICO|nr:hypothetical protein [Pedococcus dokdonensis]SDO86988.1 hypothetical protein SAMN04489867_0804 [Pedococcus dokdonensis]
MNDWFGLVPIAVGGAIALCGSLIGSTVTDRRAARRERERWEREDDLRTFDDRRALYLDLMAGFEIAQRMADKAIVSGSDVPLNWLDPILSPITRVNLFAPLEVREAVSSTNRALMRLGGEVSRVRLEDGPRHARERPEVATAEQAFLDMEDRLLAILRADLKVRNQVPIERYEP